MQVYNDRTREEQELEFSGKAKELLAKLNINPETVVVTKNGNVITEEDKVGGDDKIKILSVVSGG